LKKIIHFPWESVTSCLCKKWSHFEVRDQKGNYTLNMNNHTCDCKAWNMIGILCRHACAATMQVRGHHMTVHGYYREAAYQRAYQCMIYPIPDSRFWPKTPYTGLLHPKVTKKT